jgi:hypothetical protein
MGKISTTLYYIIIVTLLSCEDKFYKDKYDIEFHIINKTKSVIPEIKINGAEGAKTWTFKNLDPEKSEKIEFNIKRDLRISEGGFEFSAVTMTGDSLTLNTGYFTNWYYGASNPSIFNIYDDRIELQH